MKNKSRYVTQGQAVYAAEAERGFSLFELIVVLTLISILGAVLAMTFSHLAGQARELRMSETAKSLKAAVRLAQVQWRAEDRTGAARNLAGFGDGTIDVSDAGWPISAAGDRTSVSQMSTADCRDLWFGLLTDAGDGGLQKFDAQLVNRRCVFEEKSGREPGRIVYRPDTGEVRVEEVSN